MTKRANGLPDNVRPDVYGPDTSQVKPGAAGGDSGDAPAYTPRQSQSSNTATSPQQQQAQPAPVYTGPTAEELAARLSQAQRIASDRARAADTIKSQAERKSNEPAPKKPGTYNPAAVTVDEKTGLLTLDPKFIADNDVSIRPPVVSESEKRRNDKINDIHDYYQEAKTRKDSKQFRNTVKKKKPKPKPEPKEHADILVTPKGTAIPGNQRKKYKEPLKNEKTSKNISMKDVIKRPRRKVFVDESGQADVGKYPAGALARSNQWDRSLDAPFLPGGQQLDSEPNFFVDESGQVGVGDFPAGALALTNQWNRSLDAPFLPGGRKLDSEPNFFVDESGQANINPDRPRETTSPEEPSGPKLLEGYSNLYPYVVNLNKENEKMSDDEKIEQAVQQQKESIDFDSMFPNAVDEMEDFLDTSEYAEYYNSGEREQDKISGKESKFARGISETVARMKQSVARVVDWIKQAYIPMESQYIDEYGNIKFSPETEYAIANYMDYMGYAPEERYMVFHQAMKEMGFSPDRNGKYLLADKIKIPDRLFHEALNNMMISCETYGHPYGFVNHGMFLGNTRCFPVGVMTYHEAKMLCRPGHKFEGQDPWDLITKTANTWVNETLPAIRKNIYEQDNGIAQMYVLEDMVRALCSLDGISSRKYGVSELVDRGYEEMMRETMPNYKPDMTDDDILVNDEMRRRLELAKARRDRASKRLDKRRNRPKYFYNKNIPDENGEIIHRKGERAKRSDIDKYSADTFDVERNPKNNGFDSVCMSVANMAKFAGVVGYVPIMGSGVLEHAQGNIQTKGANFIMFLGKKKEAYKPTDKMYNYVTSDEGVEGIAAWKVLLDVGGQEAVTLFYNEMEQGKRVLNKKNVKEFLETYVNRIGSDKKLIRKANEMRARLDEYTAVLMPGDIGFRKADARRWLEGFMYNNMKNDNERSFTASEVLEMMDAMGIQRFLAAATDMNAGRDAMIMTRNQTLARENPLTHTCDMILRKNGVTNMAVTLGIDTYFTYGLNLIQLMIPFSNTASYLAVKGINLAATGGRNNEEKLDLNIMNYQMGGNDQFVTGLRKNLIYDLCKLANINLMGGFLYFFIKAIGFEEPPDESLKYVWSEYLVGKNIGLGGVDENGNGIGIPVYAAWWLNDLTLFALPMAYALNAHELDQKLGPNDPDLSTKLFFSGCHDMINGCGLLDMIKMVNNVQKDFETYEAMMSGDDVDCPPDWFSYGLLQAELFCARGVNKMIPNALKNFQTDTLFTGPNKFDRTAYETYDRTSNVPGKTEKVNDFFELQRRIESKYNPLYALYNNWTKNGYLFDDGTTQKTGYLFDEMPLATSSDQLQLWWANKYAYDPNKIPGGEANRIPYTEEKIEQVIADIKKFNSPEEAVNNGFMIPAALRYKMRDYCYQHINFEENLYNQRVQEGYYVNSTEKNNGYTDMQNHKQEWYNLLNNWVFNSAIPWSDQGYAKLVTSNMIVYQRKDNGQPASEWDYYVEGPSRIEKRVLPRGDHPTSFLPFTTPDPTNRGFNYETRSKWNNPGESGTDLERIYNMLQGELVPMGRDEGVPMNTAIFGGTPNFKTDTVIESSIYNALNDPTMGYRSYVPFEEDILYDLPNVLINGGYSNPSSNGSNGSNNSNGSNGSNNSSSYNGSNDSNGNNDNVSFIEDLKSVGRESVGSDSSLGDMGKYIDKESWTTTTYPNWNNQGWPNNYGQRTYYRSSGGYSSSSSSSNYNPRIYANSKSVNSDKPATMYSKQPYGNSPTSYLRPGVTTKGSREAYRRAEL